MFCALQVDGRTALMMASQEDHEAVVRTLLSSGANVNQAKVRNDDDACVRRGEV